MSPARRPARAKLDEPVAYARDRAVYLPALNRLCRSVAFCDADENVLAEKERGSLLEIIFSSPCRSPTGAACRYLRELIIILADTYTLQTTRASEARVASQ